MYSNQHSASHNPLLKFKFNCTTTKTLQFDAGNEKGRDGGASKHRLPRVASGIFVTSNAAKIQPGTPTRFPISPHCKPFNPERVFNRSLQVFSFLSIFLQVTRKCERWLIFFSGSAIAWYQTSSKARTSRGNLESFSEILSLPCSRMRHSTEQKTRLKVLI